MRFIAQAVATPSRASDARSSTRRASWAPAARWRCGVYPRRSSARATVGESRLAGRPGDLRDGARQVQADLVHAAQRRRELLDQPHAGGAVDAFEVEPRAAALAGHLLGRFGLQAPVVEVLEAAPGDARGLERAMLALDEPVVLIESPLPDERVHLPAAVAAELVRRPPRAARLAGTARPQCAQATAAFARRAGKGRVTGLPLPG